MAAQGQSMLFKQHGLTFSTDNLLVLQTLTAQMHANTPKEHHSTVTSTNSKHLTYVRLEPSCECCEVLYK
jgi:hypothetical protein